MDGRADGGHGVLRQRVAFHDPTVTAKEQWQCFEINVKLNPDPASGAGAELGVWIDDRSIQQFTDAAPLGYWVKDKFCPSAATGTECTMYRPASPTLVPLDLQWRSTTALTLDNFWPQNYITDVGLAKRLVRRGEPTLRRASAAFQ